MSTHMQPELVSSWLRLTAHKDARGNSAVHTDFDQNKYTVPPDTYTFCPVIGSTASFGVDYSLFTRIFGSISPPKAPNAASVDAATVAAAVAAAFEACSNSKGEVDALELFAAWVMLSGTSVQTKIRWLWHVFSFNQGPPPDSPSGHALTSAGGRAWLSQVEISVMIESTLSGMRNVLRLYASVCSREEKANSTHREPQSTKSLEAPAMDPATASAHVLAAAFSDETYFLHPLVVSVGSEEYIAWCSLITKKSDILAGVIVTAAGSIGSSGTSSGGTAETGPRGSSAHAHVPTTLSNSDSEGQNREQQNHNSQPSQLTLMRSSTAPSAQLERIKRTRIHRSQFVQSAVVQRWVRLASQTAKHVRSGKSLSFSGANELIATASASATAGTITGAPHSNEHQNLTEGIGTGIGRVQQKESIYEDLVCVDCNTAQGEDGTGKVTQHRKSFFDRSFFPMSSCLYGFWYPMYDFIIILHSQTHNSSCVATAQIATAASASSECTRRATRKCTPL